MKDNQPRLFEDIKTLVRAALEADFVGLSRRETDEHSHGREELRFCVVMTNLEAVRDRALWTGLKSVVCVVTRRRVSGKEGREVRYYISSRRGSGKIFLGATPVLLPSWINPTGCRFSGWAFRCEGIGALMGSQGVA